MGLKAQAPGHFLIPAAPAIGVVVASSSSANTFGSYVQMIASTSAALYITGYYLFFAAGASSFKYVCLQIGVGAAASEVIVDQAVFSTATAGGASATMGCYHKVWPPIPVAAAARIAAKTATDVASAMNWSVILECVAQADLIDMGINESADVKAINAVSTSPVTTIKAVQGLAVDGVITTLTNLPAITANWLTAAGIAADAITAAKIADGAIDTATFAGGTTIPRCTLVDTLTTYTGNTPQTGDSFARIGAAGAGLTALGDTRVANLDVTVSSRLPSATNAASIASILVATNTGAAPGAANGLLIAGSNADVSFGSLTLQTSLSAGSIVISGASSFAGGITANITGNITGTVSGNATAAQGANLDVAISSRMATYTQPTGFLAANFSTGIPVSDKTGFSLTSAYDPAKTAAQAGDAMTLTAGTGNALVAAVSAVIIVDHGAGSYIRNTEPDNTSVAAIKVKTDSLTFTNAGVLDANVLYVHNIAIDGSGTAVDPWGPV